MTHNMFLSMCETGILFKVILIVLACPIHSQYYYRQQHPYPFPPRTSMSPPPLRQVRQTPYYLNVNSQRYLAVPGQVVQHYNTAPLQYNIANVPVRPVNAPLRNPNILLRNSNIPLRNQNFLLRNPNIQLTNPNVQFRNPNIPLRNLNFPIFSTRPLLLQSYYELEADPASSSPDQEDENGGGGLEPPPPESEQQQPEQQPEQQPPESEPEEPPPMMMMTTEQPPPPPPPEDDNSENDSGNEEDGNDHNGNDDNEDEDDDPPPRPPPSHSHGKGKLVHKHISIHLPPPEMESDEPTTQVIRPKIPGPKKHLNIIFVKAPSMRGKKKTEVILPDNPEQKTLVYVLVKKPDPANDGSVKVRGPAPTKPPKPQVYFIRYKQKKKHNHHHHYHH